MKKTLVLVAHIGFLVLGLTLFRHQLAAYAHVGGEAMGGSPTSRPVVQKQTYYQGTIESIETSRSGQRIARVTIADGNLKGQSVPVLLMEDSKTAQSPYSPGDRIIALRAEVEGQPPVTYVVDFVRTDQILLLAALFAVTVILIARWHGVLSLISLAYSFLIIGRFIVPNIVAGNNPIFVSLLGGILISPVTFYISHGLNRKTTVAIVGTLCSLGITGILSLIFVGAAKLTGVTSDEALYVKSLVNENIDLRSLLLASMIIGTLGILDDITVSQASIVDKLIRTSKDMKFWEVFGHAMDVGKDHIASLVNTLMLVYAGASLPLFLLFYDSQVAPGYAISNEIVATELVRTLIGSIGLVAAVPVTTILACLAMKKTS